MQAWTTPLRVSRQIRAAKAARAGRCEDGCWRPERTPSANPDDGHPQPHRAPDPPKQGPGGSPARTRPPHDNPSRYEKPHVTAPIEDPGPTGCGVPFRRRLTVPGRYQKTRSPARSCIRARQGHTVRPHADVAPQGSSVAGMAHPASAQANRKPRNSSRADWTLISCPASSLSRAPSSQVARYPYRAAKMPSSATR